MTKLLREPAERAWVEVNLASLVRNARRYQELSGAPLLPMVKADGYGLGACRIAQALEPLEPWGYGVATAGEGAELRSHGITRSIVVFTPLLPEAGAIAALRAARLQPVIGDLEALQAWLAAAGGPFQVEIDTGMSRSGFRWHDDATLRALATSLGTTTDWNGVFTHFHSAESDPESVRIQSERFETVLRGFEARPRVIHLANSAAAALGPEAGGDLGRPGIFLYGGCAGSLVPEPVAALKARVVALRRLRAGDTVSYGAEATMKGGTTIATLAIGYADGVPRALSNRGSVELNGAVLPIAGRVTMDMLMVDAGELPIRTGDVATLFGGRISLDEQARSAGTVSYELLTRLSPRLPRRYLES